MKRVNWSYDCSLALPGFPPVSSIWIPWLSLTLFRSFSLTFPDLVIRIWQASHGNPSEARKNFGHTNILLSKICLEIYDKISTKSDQNSLTFPDSRQDILKFPDFPEGNTFPWFSLIFPDGGNPALLIETKTPFPSSNGLRLHILFTCNLDLSSWEKWHKIKCVSIKHEYTQVKRNSCTRWVPGSDV